MVDLLFAYGTLISGYEPAHMSTACARLKVVGDGTVRGLLYDFGAFPAVVPGNGIVRGVVMRVPPDAWAALDRYEGCAASGSAEGLFQRAETRAALDTGETLDCWLYIYTRDVRAGRLMESGDWRRRRSL